MSISLVNIILNSVYNFDKALAYCNPIILNKTKAVLTQTFKRIILNPLFPIRGYVAILN